MTHWSYAVAKMNACRDAVAWLATQPDTETAWRECKRGDWMLWLLGKQAGAPGSDARRPLVLAACACARLALPYVREGELRPLQAIETAERWARGEANAPSLDEVRKAAAAAYADAAAAAAADAAAAYADAYAERLAARKHFIGSAVDILRKLLGDVEPIVLDDAAWGRARELANINAETLR